jgi:hypothetical protein
VEATLRLVAAAAEHHELFNWHHLKSPKTWAGRESRMDFSAIAWPPGVTSRRRRAPFGDGEFGLALCSHLLFYSEQLSFDFHVRSVIEMARAPRKCHLPFAHARQYTAAGRVPAAVALGYELKSARCRTNFKGRKSDAGGSWLVAGSSLAGR